MEISIKWNICRICLVEESRRPNEFYRAISEVKDLSRQVYDLTGIIIKSGDSLPDKACFPCIKAIRNASNLRSRCVKSDNYLKTILKRTQTATSICRPEESDNPSEESDFEQDYFENAVDIGEKKWMDKDDEKDNVSLNSNCSVRPNNVNYRKSKLTNEEFLSCQEDIRKNLKILNTKIKKENKSSSSTSQANSDMENYFSQEQNISKSLKTLVPPKDKEKHEEESNLTMDEFRHVDGNLDEEIILPTCEEISSTSHANLNNSPSKESIISLNEAASSENSQENDSSISLNNIENIYMILNGNTIKKENLNNFSNSSGLEGEGDGEGEGEVETEEEPTSSNTIKMIDGNDYLEEVEELQEVEVHEIEEEASQDGDKDMEEVLGEMTTLESYEGTSNATLSDLNEIEYLTDDLDEMNENIPEKELLEFESNSITTNVSRDGSPYLEVLNERRDLKSFSKREVYSRSKVVCDQCGNHFAGRSHLNNHMRTHLQPKKFECELCHKRFNAACNLNQHMRTHTGERPYECEFCHRRFTDRSTHVKHVRIHTNEKPFNCSYCGKSFSLSTTLKAHEKIHTGEKPFRCDPCGKSFKLAHHLKAHEKTYLHKFVTYREE